MTREELLARLGDHEDNFVERKLEGIRPSDIRKAAVAFSNSLTPGREAVLFIGVADDGKLVGCSNADGKQKAVRAECGSCYPPITPTCEVIRCGEIAIVAVVFGASNNRPHFAGTAYVRQGSESVAAPSKVFDELVHSRNDIVAELLRLKSEGRVVNVTGLGHRLGEIDRLPNRAYKEAADCRILDCDAHDVVFENIGSGLRFSEPVSHIKVLTDVATGRKKLVANGY